MNERITEIARTAGAKVSEIDAGYGIITKTVLYDEDIEEFAEKIIQECIDVINNDIKYNQLILHNDTGYKIHNMASLTGVIGKIKQHFGLE